MTPGDRLQAILARLGCLGVTGLIIFAVILAIAGTDWFGPSSAVAR
ncbi:hypothetical protein [Phenylobacterium sp.]|nr:hypothetical protein [Phenylobacterium sp.]